MYRIKMSIHSLKVYLFTKMYFGIFIPLTSGLFLAMDDQIHSTQVLSIQLALGKSDTNGSVYTFLYGSVVTICLVV